tara:strand:+ start:288 stop:662 length:375 start_codon:yes stop_codon:yes gene_type:complete
MNTHRKQQTRYFLPRSEHEFEARQQPGKKYRVYVNNESRIMVYAGEKDGDQEFIEQWQTSDEIVSWTSELSKIIFDKAGLMKLPSNKSLTVYNSRKPGYAERREMLEAANQWKSQKSQRSPLSL